MFMDQAKIVVMVGHTRRSSNNSRSACLRSRSDSHDGRPREYRSLYDEACSSVATNQLTVRGVWERYLSPKCTSNGRRFLTPCNETFPRPARSCA